MREDIFKEIQVYFPTMKEADYAINYLRDKIKESDRHYASVIDLISCSGYRSVSHKFALLPDDQLYNWGWSVIDGYSIRRDVVTKSVILTMPPAKRMYYPLTPPPQPTTSPKKIVYPKSKYADYVLNIPRKEIRGAKTKLEVSDELSSYSYHIEPAPIKMPTREEIAASIKVYKDYNIDKNAYKLYYTYKDRATDHTFYQSHVVNMDDHLLEDEVRYEMWDKAWREELISAVMKDYEAKKKEREKEKLKMFLNNSDAVYKKIYEYATNFEIESRPEGFNTATIECPVYRLNGLLGLEDNTAKKSKPVKNVEITNIEMYNDRVVKVTFDDGSFTKSVCQENDIFDLDVGITVCLMKKMLDDGKGNGTRIYNDIIRNAHKLINDKENEKIEKQMEKEKQKKKAHKAMMKRQAKKMKAKEEAIDTQKLAFIRALQETGMIKDAD